VVALGLHLPVAGPMASPELVRSAAQLADRNGFDSVWLLDHLFTPTELSSPYPYTADGSYLFSPEDPFFDALGVMGYVAGATDRVRIGTAVMVAPLRHPILLARYLGTLAALAGDRLVLGVAPGWMREEYDAVGVPFSNRGTRLEHVVAAMRRIWSEEVTSSDDPLYPWPEAGFRPVPPAGSVPILIGGHSDRAIERAARLGDGWAATVPGTASADLDRFAERMSVLDGALAAQGRGRDGFTVHLLVTLAVRPWTRTDRPRPPFVGEPEEVAADVRRAEELGVTVLDCFVPARDADGFLAGAQAIADELLPLL
jgi:probable F420-dependent oxidoreductase